MLSAMIISNPPRLSTPRWLQAWLCFLLSTIGHGPTLNAIMHAMYTKWEYYNFLEDVHGWDWTSQRGREQSKPMATASGAQFQPMITRKQKQACTRGMKEAGNESGQGHKWWSINILRNTHDGQALILGSGLWKLSERKVYETSNVPKIKM